MIVTESQRLRIEKATTSDAPFLFKLMNSLNWIEFIGDRNIKSEQAASDYIQHNLINSYERNGYGLYKMILTTDNEPIGLCGFIKRDYLDHADIGFAILPEHEGKGYTYEALMAVMEYGKRELKLNPILAITTNDNVKSRHLLNKIGLVTQGTIKPIGREEDFMLFSNQEEEQVGGVQ
jgi:RimJ/RimL family protein N-acetyltransferase